MTVRIFGRTPLGQPGLHCPGDRRPGGICCAVAAGHAAGARGQGERQSPCAASPVDWIPAIFSAHSNSRSHFTRSLPKRSQSPSAGPNVLASHVSPPLGDDLVVTNKVSQNLHAEITLRTLGKFESSDGSLLEGTRVVRQFLISAGVRPPTFVLFDGCGLSVQDLVTPRAFTTLLSYAARQSWGEAFRTSFPVGGVDGSLSGRFKQPCARRQGLRQDGYPGRSPRLERIPGRRQRPDGRLLHHVHRSQSVLARGPHGDGQDRRGDRRCKSRSRIEEGSSSGFVGGVWVPHLPPSKPLSELTPQEAAGRQVFVSRCSSCHYAEALKRA